MNDKTTTPQWQDLGLSYKQAAHGVQSAMRYRIEGLQWDGASSKNLRVGVNVAMVDHAALAYLLVEKGIITETEYREALRLAMNHELWREQQSLHPLTFR